jgi:hypothetical protein
MELVSRNLRRTPPPSAGLERSEYARRDRDMLWYLLRGSIWETYTRFVKIPLRLRQLDDMYLFSDRNWKRLSTEHHMHPYLGSSAHLCTIGFH